MLEVIGLVLTAILTENMVLVRCFGLSGPKQSVTSQDGAVHMGVALTMVMVSAALASWWANTYILRAFQVEYYRLMVYALAVPAVVWLWKQVLRLFFPVLYRHLNDYLTETVSNCAVLAVAFLITNRSYSLGQTLLYSLASGIGVLLILVSFANIREQTGQASHPESLRDLPIGLITMGLMAMALMGFYGLHVMG